MNFGFNEEQELLRSTARKFFDNECSSETVRKLMDSPEGMTPDLWKKLAEQGWTGLILPEAYDGMGLGLVDLVVLLEEMGRTAQAPDHGDFEPFVQADMRFHLAILHACRNELLEQMSRVVYSALLVSFRATSRLPGRAKAALPKHRAILDAIRARDPRGAGSAMRHLVQTTARDVEALSKRPRPRR